MTEFRIPFDSSFVLDNALTLPASSQENDKKYKSRLKLATNKLYELQRKLYAEDRHAVLLIFQAMDAAGKDSTIRHVMSGVNPAGCQVFSFKAPSKEELDHDFLWRSSMRLPERGRIGIFNRSYYEETLVVRVHPEYLQGQRLPEILDYDGFWEQRFQSIRDHELHLARNGTTIIKFWLNVSRDEQKRRFLSRLNESDKNWKFSKKDVDERSYWDEYMAAYQSVLNATSRDYAPWYAIPADKKPFMRLKVAEIIVESLENLKSRYPRAAADEAAEFAEIKAQLENEN